MLGSHLNALEVMLAAQSVIASNTGHPLHKGTPREVFLRDFLQNHLPATVAVGSGEIIDANSKPNEPRNQFDLVIYRRDFPKLHISEGVSAFMAESVVATIEVKSTLDKAGIVQAAKAAANAKRLKRSIVKVFDAGYIPPAILNLVVAYDGPALMSTVAGWICEANKDLGITPPDLPNDLPQRLATPAPSIDGAIILQRGYVHYDNLPVHAASSGFRENTGPIHWHVVSAPGDNLLYLFILLQTALANVQGYFFDPMPYVKPNAKGTINFVHEGPILS